jgi:hypothetical protein
MRSWPSTKPSARYLSRLLSQVCRRVAWIELYLCVLAAAST